MKTLLTIFVLALSISTCFAQKMRYNFKEGQVVRMNQNFDIIVDQDIQGSPMVVKTSITTDTRFTVSEVNDGVAKLEAVYDFMGMNLAMDMMGSKMSFAVDSNNPPEEPMMMESHEVFKSFIGIPFYIHLNEQGEVLKTEGIEELAQRMYEVTTNQDVINSMEENFGAEKLKNDYSRMFAYYPEDRLKEGKTYTTKVSMQELGVVDKDQLWTVGYVNASKNQMELSSNISDLNMQRTENGVQLNLTGDMSMDFMVDTVSGWPQQMELNSIMEGQAKSVSEEFGDMSWPMKMTLSGTTTFEIE